MDECVPDRAASAVLIDGALDLIGGSSKATRRVAVQCRFCESSRQALVLSSRFRLPRSVLPIDLIGGNPVDLECDRSRGPRVDAAYALEILRAHREVHNHVHRKFETGWDLDI